MRAANIVSSSSSVLGSKNSRRRTRRTRRGRQRGRVHFFALADQRPILPHQDQIVLPSDPRRGRVCRQKRGDRFATPRRGDHSRKHIGTSRGARGSKYRARASRDRLVGTKPRKCRPPPDRDKTPPRRAPRSSVFFRSTIFLPVAWERRLVAEDLAVVGICLHMRAQSALRLFPFGTRDAEQRKRLRRPRCSSWASDKGFDTICNVC